MSILEQQLCTASDTRHSSSVVLSDKDTLKDAGWLVCGVSIWSSSGLKDRFKPERLTSYWYELAIKNALTSGWVEFLALVFCSDIFLALIRYDLVKVSRAYFTTSVALRSVLYKLWQRFNIAYLHPSFSFLEGDSQVSCFKTKPKALTVTWEIKGGIFITDNSSACKIFWF